MLMGILKRISTTKASRAARIEREAMLLSPSLDQDDLTWFGYLDWPTKGEKGVCSSQELYRMELNLVMRRRIR